MAEAALQARLHGLYAMFWYGDGPDPHGLLVRTALISTLAVIAVLAGCVRWCIYAVELRRTRTRPWLWRFVVLPSGSFFVLNQQLVSSVTGVWTGATFVATRLYFLHVFRHDTSRAHLGALEATIYIPLSISGWLVGWSILQANLIVMEREARWAARAARVAAVAFFVGSALVIPLVVVIPLMASRRWADAVAQFLLVRDLMEATLRAGTAGDPAVLAVIDAQVERGRLLIAWHDAAHSGVNAMFGVLSLAKAVLGLASISIYLVVRRQLRESARDLVLHSDALTAATIHSPSLPRLAAPAAPDSDSESHSEPEAKSKNPFNALVRLGPASPAPWPQPPPPPAAAPVSQSTRNLKYARSKILVYGLATVSSGLCFAGVFAWSVTVPTLHLPGTSWGRHEASLFFVASCWAVIFAPASVVLTWQAYQQLPDRHTGAPVLPAEDGFLGGDREACAIGVV